MLLLRGTGEDFAAPAHDDLLDAHADAFLAASFSAARLAARRYASARASCCSFAAFAQCRLWNG